MKISINKYGSAAVAYIELSEDQVAKTIEFNDDVLIDLDSFDCVRGVELLNPTELPLLADLEKKSYIKDEHLGAVLILGQQITSGLLYTRT